MIKKIFIAVLLANLLFPTGFISATNFSSPNFIVKDPVIKIGGVFATSTSFQLWSSLGQEAIGISTTTDFGLRGGFLYFVGAPQAPSGLSATAASQTQINLSWTDNSTDETGFKIERSLTSGSGFSQIATTSAHAVSYSNTSLSAATTYYYRIRAYNADGNSNYSGEANATTQSATVTAPIGGGGGGGGPPPAQTMVIFKGMAYPLSDVTLLKDAKIATITKAGPDAKFEIQLSGLTAGTYSFGIWAEDYQGIRSVTQSFTITITQGVTTIISGIFLPPTITADKTEVKRGDVLNILGQTAPAAQITLAINSEQELVKKTISDSSGIWLYKFDTYEIDYGDHSAQGRSAFLDNISPSSQLVFFKVGQKSVLAAPSRKCPIKGDFNSDCAVNLVDFSIAAYWYKRTLTPVLLQIEKEQSDGDGKIDLIDFSIMAYYWTG